MTDTSQCRKGIILAGGSGTRLAPATKAVSKQLLPVYDKPMIYYPLSVLILAGIRDVLVISTPHDIGGFSRLLGDGSHLGLRMQYAVQPKPEGIAQAFLIGQDFIGTDDVALILGDNIFYSQCLDECLDRGVHPGPGALIVAKAVGNPQRYGVVTLDKQGVPISVIEKPAQSSSNLAVTGLYFYDHRVVEIAAGLQPSPRRELEITDVNQAYLERGQLDVLCLDADSAWFDAGTHESYLAASVFVEMVQTERQTRIGSIEEAAFRRGLITAEALLALSEQCPNDYGDYLRAVANGSMGRLQDAHI